MDTQSKVSLTHIQGRSRGGRWVHLGKNLATSYNGVHCQEVGPSREMKLNQLPQIDCHGQKI